jgi:hypothetical protein
MPEMNALASPDPQADEGRIIKLAVLAVGGQGGGVLADWITDVAERSGYVAQSTSVAGVAQRTGVQGTVGATRRAGQLICKPLYHKYFRNTSTLGGAPALSPRLESGVQI